ncbi:hypothetical protein BDV18DRAFT_128469 [Aspergillus unguis]
MSLKRKASFPSIASPQSAQSPFDRPFMDDSPKHLHSRTRKRVRNDRPDDQTVYDKTLHRLFTAQQRVQQMPTPPADQDEDMEPEAPIPAVDQRQKTLLQFFRPAQPSHQPCPSTPARQFPSEPSRSIKGFPGYNSGSVSPTTPSTCDRMTPTRHFADRDMDVDMDIDMEMDESPNRPSNLTGLLGWMR